jgi:ubiquinone/menaquinone biosynthesis C-methylase UbiE
MGEQIHIGGFASSMDLADKARIGKGHSGVDLCCCNGAGMRFLVRYRQVAAMHGVDATAAVVADGKARCKRQGLDKQIEFTLCDVCKTPLKSGAADFVWGEDAWCYVQDKPALIAEAVRLVKSGGTIAFTDWIEAPGMSAPDAQRYLKFMKFPNIVTVDEYVAMLRANGCEVELARNTGRFAPCVDLYINMLNMQLTGDALRILGGDAQMLGMLAGEFEFVRRLAHAGKVDQAIFVARKAN